MDNFTLAVLVGDALVVIVLIALFFMDKGKSGMPDAGSAKAAGKKSA